jgi:hypothetical protein
MYFEWKSVIMKCEMRVITKSTNLHGCISTNKNHSYKHNEQINNRNIENYLKQYGFGWLYKGFFFTCGNTFGHMLNYVFWMKVSNNEMRNACNNKIH